MTFEFYDPNAPTEEAPTTPDNPDNEPEPKNDEVDEP